MLRAIIRTLFGRSEPPSPERQEQSSGWRKAPEKTWTADLAEGISVTTTVTTGHHGFLSVVGESHYQNALRPLADRLGPDGVFIARLVREPDNPYDASAVAVCVDGTLAKVGHLARQVAENYHQRLVGHGAPVTCPAKLTGVGRGTVGVVLDFEDVRVALGLPRVSVDQSDMDYAAAAEYHRLNNANRVFVHETRPLEKSDPVEAVARYRRAVTVLKDCRDLGRARGLESYGFTPNQTDAVPIERLTMCLVKMRRIEEASAELEDFLEAFPSAKNMTLVANVRERIDRARQRTAASGSSS